MKYISSARKNNSKDNKGRSKSFFSKSMALTNVRQPFFQPKLTVNQVNDKYEQEADAMAEQVVTQSQITSHQSLLTNHLSPLTPHQVPTSSLARKCTTCKEEGRLQREELLEEMPEKLQPKKLMRSSDVSGIQAKKTGDTIYEGQDHAGNYKIDTANCRMHYNADWYFNFKTAQSDTEKQKYMETAKRHVEATWSNKMKLKPTNSTQDCLCSNEGFSIYVILNPKESSREGQHGFSTTVVSSVRAHVIPPLRTVDLQSNDAIPYTFPHSGTTQKIISHEFGHTLGLPDEYHALSPFKKNYQSIMNVGDTIYPRHYAPFANILNYEILGCDFAPEGKKTPFDIPVTKQDYRFLMPIMSEDAPETVFDFHLMRRTSNQAMLGLFHPFLGLQSRMNFGNQSILGGPRAYNAIIT